jgi:L-arabinose transport system ATP-binding protein
MLEIDNLRVTFPGVIALDAVSFSVAAGSVHALMGENGAGKSTLLKTLSGVNRPASGGVRIDGTALACGSPRAAIESGVAVIYQELNLVPQLTVAENLSLGHFPQRLGFLDRAALKQRARAQLEKLGEDIDPDCKVGDLSIGQRQMVEIGKALSRNARVLAMDEPTSSLSSREVDNLMRIIGELKAQGKVILYVSHRMDEIYRICDGVTVLRDGRHVATHAHLKAVPPDTLVSDMVGRPIKDVYGYRPRGLGAETLSVRGVHGPGVEAPASFSVRAGEIVGLFGLIGAGRTELIKLLYGATRRHGGEVQWKGRKVDFKSPRDAIAAGWGLCPEDRRHEGIVPGSSLSENLNLSCRGRISRFGVFLNVKREAANARQYIDSLSIKTRSSETAIQELSGGNQQKVILARWLTEGCDLFLMDEPTRGIDIGARADIYDILYRQAEAGKIVIVVSSDIAEVAGICDRVLVMREGTLAGELARAQATPEALLTLALPSNDATHQRGARA